VLSRDEFVFYGRSFRLDDLDQVGKDGVAILRVLAERAGKFTARGDIIKECVSPSDVLLDGSYCELKSEGPKSSGDGRRRRFLGGAVPSIPG
jgi:hypothetical protein